MPRRAEFLSRVEANLRGHGLRVSCDVDLPGGQSAAVFGSRTYVSWAGLAVVSQHVCVQDCGGASPTPADAKALFDAGFRRARRANRVPLLRGMRFGYLVVPCLVVGSADPALIAYAEGRPARRWALVEFPVVVDRVSGHTHYYRTAAGWGSARLAAVRTLVERCIASAADFR